MRIGIIGSRTFNDYEVVKETMNDYVGKTDILGQIILQNYSEGLHHVDVFAELDGVPVRDSGEFYSTGNSEVRDFMKVRALSLDLDNEGVRNDVIIHVENIDGIPKIGAIIYIDGIQTGRTDTEAN